MKIKVLGCVIGRRRITIQPSPSGLDKTIILKPIFDFVTTLKADVVHTEWKIRSNKCLLKNKLRNIKKLR